MTCFVLFSSPPSLSPFVSLVYLLCCFFYVLFKRSFFLLSIPRTKINSWQTLRCYLKSGGCSQNGLQSAAVLVGYKRLGLLWVFLLPLILIKWDTIHFQFVLPWTLLRLTIPRNQAWPFVATVLLFNSVYLQDLEAPRPNIILGQTHLCFCYGDMFKLETQGECISLNQLWLTVLRTLVQVFFCFVFFY